MRQQFVGGGRGRDRGGGNRDRDDRQRMRSVRVSVSRAGHLIGKKDGAMRRFNPKTIGAFVVGAIALAVIAVAVIGSSHFFGKRYKYVLCFPGDLSGLSVGAPVKFRGVRIGSVVAIRLNLQNTSPLLTKSSQESRIPVIIELDETQVSSRSGRVNMADPKWLDLAVARGLR